MTRREKLFMFGFSWTLTWLALSALNWLSGVTPSAPASLMAFMGCCTWTTVEWLMEKPLHDDPGTYAEMHEDYD